MARELSRMSTSATLQRFEDRLRQETHSEVRFDRGTRLLYGTDASLYQIEPIGVLVPRTQEDVAIAMRIAHELGMPVLPRGGATSLSGQVVGEALVIDFSKYLNRIGVVDRDRMTVRVEPGVVLDQLNRHLKPLGLMFGPDVSTSDRATLGGLIGNNSAGARSLRFGKTVDHVRSLDVVLDDGTRATLGPVSSADLGDVCCGTDRVAALHRGVRDTVAGYRSAIESHYPRILRRVSGYNLDEFIPGFAVRAEDWPDEPWNFNLARLIVGSEGTLAVVTSAELRVVPIPPAQGLVVLSFATIAAALDRLGEILETRPVSVELLDRMILDLAADNPEMAQHLTFAEGRPEAVLAAQYYEGSAEALAARAEDLAQRFVGRPGVLGVRKSLSSAAKDDFWKVRKAGLSLLMGMVGDAKPIAFVEDAAVAPERLPEFYERFRQIIEKQGAVGACYGHADVGCLHIRPILNVKTERGVEQMRAIAEEVSDLVAEFGGAMSGEHGDGLARSLWNRKLFGDEVYSAFLSIKRLFDPSNRMNPGKVVAETDLGEHLRIGPDYHAREPERTILDFSHQGGFARAVEMCSGVGACRKPTGGTMCPSYMVTRDEEHSTRGRANALRLVMSGALPAEGLAEDTLDRALDLCLQCKACKTECPSNVDMAKLKVEYLHQKYHTKTVPFGSLLMGNIHRLNPIGSATAPLANWSLRQPWMKWTLEKVAGIDRRRTLPAFARNHFREWFRSHAIDPRSGPRGRVVLIDDCFTTFNTPEIGRAAVKVLEAAGFHVELAGLECCGRPAFSKGLVPLARRLAEDNVRRLQPIAAEGVPILGLEPSCLTMFIDEYRDLRLGPKASEVAGVSRMIDSFLADTHLVPDLPVKLIARTALLHGHCQQKALMSTGATLGALKRIPGLNVSELDSGCCGMAGSFGYEKGHYELSEALANRVLLPAVAAQPDALLIAPGFSCRSQVLGLKGVVAKHPIEVLAEAIEPFGG